MLLAQLGFAAVSAVIQKFECQSFDCINYVRQNFTHPLNEIEKQKFIMTEKLDYAHTIYTGTTFILALIFVYKKLFSEEKDGGHKIQSQCINGVRSIYEALKKANQIQREAVEKIVRIGERVRNMGRDCDRAQINQELNQCSGMFQEAETILHTVKRAAMAIRQKYCTNAAFKFV